MYPLLVACKSISNLRKEAAQEVVDKVRQHSGILVDEVWERRNENSLVAAFLLDLTLFLELKRPNLCPLS